MGLAGAGSQGRPEPCCCFRNHTALLQSGLVTEPELILGNRLTRGASWGDNSELGSSTFVEGFTKEVILELSIDRREQFARLARPEAPPAKGAASAEAGTRGI